MQFGEPQTENEAREEMGRTEWREGRKEMRRSDSVMERGGEDGRIRRGIDSEGEG